MTHTCPACGHDMVEEHGHLRCTSCKRIGASCCEGTEGTCEVSDDAYRSFGKYVPKDHC